MIHRALGAEKYGLRELAGDCSGGIIAALIALPYGLAMASLMGLPPVLGVFTSILTAPVIALMGRNPVLIGGTASATVPFLAMAAKQRGIAGVAQLSILAAVIMIGFAVTRVGRHITRVPAAVVTGFSCGIGAMMLISQLDLIMGVPHAAGAPLMQLADALRHAGDTHLVPMVLGVCVIVVATFAARFSPHAPAPLVGVALAILLARLFDLREQEVGLLPAALPPLVPIAWSAQSVLAALPQPSLWHSFPA